MSFYFNWIFAFFAFKREKHEAELVHEAFCLCGIDGE